MSIIHTLNIEDPTLPSIEHFNLVEAYECRDKGLTAMLFTNEYDNSVIYEIYRDERAIFLGGSTGRPLSECRQAMLEIMNEKIFLPVRVWPQEV